MFCDRTKKWCILLNMTDMVAYTEADWAKFRQQQAAWADFKKKWGYPETPLTDLAQLEARFEARQAALQRRIKAERAFIDIFVTREEDHYEIWVGPDWIEIVERDLDIFFTPHQAQVIIAHKPDLGPYNAVKFSHPYTPQLDHSDIDRNQLRYAGLASIEDDEDDD